MRRNLEDSTISGSVLANGNKFGVNSQVLAGTLTLVAGSPQIQSLDCGGAGRTVLLPAEADSKGLFFLFSNWSDAAETLTIKEDSNTTTIITVAQAKGGMVWCDGTQWRGVISA